MSDGSAMTEAVVENAAVIDGSPASPSLRARTTRSHGAWTTEYLTDLSGFERIGDEWDDLGSRCASTTPFQLSGWLTPWWRHYGPGKLRVIVVRHEGVLVAGAALFVERRLGVPVLTPAGRGLSDMTDVLLDDAHAERAARVLSAALLAMPGWEVMDLPEVRPDAAVLRLVGEWPKRWWEFASSTVLEIPSRPMETLLAEVPRSTRKSLKRRLRGVADAGVEIRSVEAARVPAAVRTLIALHEHQWRGRGGNPEHLTDRFRSLLCDAVGSLAATGDARLEEYLVDGRVLGSELLLVGPGSVSSYFVGLAPELRETLDTAALTIPRGLHVALALGRPRLSLLRGDEEYKRRWRPVPVSHRRLLLARTRGPLPVAVAGIAAARASVRSHLVRRHPGLHAALAETRRRAVADGPVAAGRTLVRAMTPNRQSTEPSSRLRVMHVSQPVEGGVRTVVASVIADQHQRGWDVLLACPPGGLADDAAAAGVPVVPWRATRGPGLGVISECRSLREMLDRFAPDVVHLHSSKAGLAGRLVLRGSRPTVFQPHGWSFNSISGWSPPSAAWERFGSRWTDHLICVSDQELASGRRRGISARAGVIPNGVDTDHFRPIDRAAARQALELDDRPTALCVGRLAAEKGQDILLTAWPLVLDRVPDAQLLLVGDGPCAVEWRSRYSPTMQESVRWEGQSADPADYYVACDLVVLPSRTEGMALAPLEAMASGRSVVAFDVGGSRQSIGDAGAVVPPRDLDALAAAIAERLCDPQRAAAEGRRGRIRAVELFDRRLSADRTAEIVSSLGAGVVR